MGYGKRLKTLDDVRRYLADLIRRVESGKVDATIAGRLGYLANLLKGCIVDGELAQRVEALERQLGSEK